MSEEYLHLLNQLHKAQETNNSKKQDTLLLQLTMLHIKELEIEKAKASLAQIKNKELPLYHYYLALTNIKEEQLSAAKKHLKKEIELHSSSEAKFLLEKLEISNTKPIITVSLTLLCFAVFLLLGPTTSYSDLLRYGVVNSSFMLSSLFSSLFVHINASHFVVNMFALLAFGMIAEKLVGSLRFVIVFLSGGLVGNFLESLWGSGDLVVGASAGIFAILGMLVMREPLFKVRLLGIIEMPLYFVLPLFFTLLSIFSPFSIELVSSSAHFAHLFGLLTGVLLTGLMYSYSMRMFYFWLLFSFGFWLFFYSATSFFYNLTSYDFIVNIFYVIMSILGLLLIAYSYSFIKDLEVKT